MTKSKKLWLIGGMATAAIVPIIAVVSCGSAFPQAKIQEITTTEILPTAPKSSTGKVLINATGTDATTINNYVSTLTTAQLNALVTTTATTKAANDAVAADFTLGTLPGTPGTVTAKIGTPVVDARFNTVVNVPVYFETTNSTAAKNEAAVVVVQIPAFQKPSDNYRGKTIATAFGDQNNQRWVNATKFSNNNTLSLGYNATTSNTSVTTDQNSFVQNAIINGVAGVSLGASDSSGAASALADAAKSSVPVVAYDRLITNPGATYNFYSTFNNEKVGELQALALTAGLLGETEPFASVEAMVTKIKTLTSKPNIGAILIAGSPTDNNSNLFYQGAWTVIQAFIQEYSGTTTGTVNGNITTYGSNFWIAGGTTFDKVATTDWLPANARTKLDTTLADINAAGKLSELKGVLAPNDNIATDAVVTGLNTAQADLAKTVYITGQDANTSSVDNIKANGGQNMTILKSDFALTAVNLSVISWLIQNNAATKKYSDLTTAEQASLIEYVKVANPNIEFTIDTTSFKDSDNKVIATFLLKPQTITATNVGTFFK